MQKGFCRRNNLFPGQGRTLSYCLGSRNRQPTEFGSQHVTKMYVSGVPKSNCLSLIDSKLSGPFNLLNAVANRRAAAKASSHSISTLRLQSCPLRHLCGYSFRILQCNDGLTQLSL